MKQILLFDLGDTLIYRKNSHLELDVELLSSLTQSDQQSISTTLHDLSPLYPGVYSPWKDNDQIKNLSQETQYNTQFFTKVFDTLNITLNPEEVVDSRFSQQRYFLFPDTISYLSRLKNHGFSIGIFTNGRPSRRLILSQLEIDEYIENDLIFISDEMGLSKPNPESFRHIQSREPLAKISLIDDEQPNINTAIQIGWTPYPINHKDLGYKILDELVQ